MKSLNTAELENLFVSDAAAGAITAAKIIRAQHTQDFTHWCERAGAQTLWAQNNGYEAGLGQILILPDAAGGIDSVLVGLGDKNNKDNEYEIPFALGACVPLLPTGVYRLSDDAPALVKQFAALAWGLGAYNFNAYKTATSKSENPQLIIADTLANVLPLLNAIYLTRDLINTPACDMLPQDLEAAMRELATEYNASFAATIGEELCAQNLNLIYAVGAAARHNIKTAPRLLELNWGEAQHPQIILIGKGVCFDSGGLNIKTGNGMGLMKKDMGGAAIAIGLAKAIMAAKLPLRIKVLVGAVENAIGADAFRPGDIITSHKGLKVEIGNTDAEGRLVLADLLSIASDNKNAPELIIDFATLTGAARVALGPELVPFYTYDDALAEKLAAAAKATADPLWRMPLWGGYKGGLKSETADINHISASPLGGSITAALFLAKFVEAGQAWVHFDAYAWQPKAKPARPQGGAAQTLAAMFHYLKQSYKNE